MNDKTRRSFLQTIGQTGSVVAFGGCASIRKNLTSKQPNIVFIFIDDMGYGDLGCTGNPYMKTPNIDRLASEGIRFSQYYVNAPVCSPSRAAVTTGRFPAVLGINSYFSSRKSNRERNMPDYLDPSLPTIAKYLKQSGYAAGHFGKWHMGGGRDVDDAPHPQAYGFDESLVSFEGLGDRILPLPEDGLTRQSKKLKQGKIREVPKHELTENYVNRAIDFIERNQKNPFYVQLWLNDIHDPFYPKENLLKKYQHISVNPYVQKYCAVLDELDRQVGRVVDSIDRMGLSEDTLIVLTSDNGPTAWPKYYNEGYDPPGETAGFRGRKWSLYEGGIRMPLIARWKGRIPEGKVNTNTVMSSIDLLPTFCSLSSSQYNAQHMDGEDFSHALFGGKQTRTKPLYWRYGIDSKLRPGLENDQSPSLALREDSWKCLVNPDGSDLELYDINTDPNESENLVNTNPKTAKEMSMRLLAWNQGL